MSPIPQAPPLPDGLVAFVKRDCPTCELVVPVLHELQQRDTLTVFTQDDPDFPAAADWVRHDSDLSVSWHQAIETVPTLYRIVNGKIEEQTEGWSRDEWERVSGIDGLGDGLPEWRPGCGSANVDPANAARVARFEASGLHSRRIELATAEDNWEAMWDRGWSDGLPVVPPTESRVLRMLEGTNRDADDVVATVPPVLVPCTVEKVAINAVLAGCRPEYLPIVIAAVEAACTDEFNIHGVLATTMSVGPVLVVNGPVAKRIGLSNGINALGQGNRANSTIGRALQLVIRNVGGGRPGEVDRATLGSPAKVGLCFAEHEEDSPWTSLAESRGWRREQSTVTLFAGESPHIFMDERSRTAESLIRHLALVLRASVTPRIVIALDAMLIISPEHLARFVDGGWSRDRFMSELNKHLLVDADELLAGTDGIEAGLPAAAAGQKLPKYRPGGLLVTHTGGPAGLFSAIISGWASGTRGSDPVTREITA